jgi:hypothetical protein
MISNHKYFYTMDEILQHYIETSFSFEFQDELKRSLEIIDTFQSDFILDKLNDIINQPDEEVEADVKKDQIAKVIKDQVRLIVSQHSIFLTEEATLFECNEFANILFLLQHLEDYSTVIRELESFNDDHLLISEIFSNFSVIDVTHFMTLIDKVGDNFIVNLKSFIYQKEKLLQRDITSSRPIVEAFKIFLECFENQKSIGEGIVKNNVPLGQKLDIYLEFITLDKTDLPKCAFDLFSLILISSEGLNAPLMTFRKYSDSIFGDLNTISSVEVELSKLINRFNDYRKMKNEKARISQASN